MGSPSREVPKTTNRSETRTANSPKPSNNPKRSNSPKTTNNPKTSNPPANTNEPNENSGRRNIFRNMKIPATIFPEPKKCCCCIDLRVGCLIIGYSGIIAGLVRLYYGAPVKIHFPNAKDFKLPIVLYVLLMIFLVIFWLIYFLLLVGVYKRSDKILGMVVVALSVSFAVDVIVHCLTLNTVEQLIILLITAAFEIYIILCIRSYYMRMYQQQNATNINPSSSPAALA